MIRYLQARWKDKLPEGKIPTAMVKLMAARDEFRRAVDHLMCHGALPFPDLDFHPVVTKAPDGTYRDLMLEELGFDPAEFICVDCETEIPRGRGRCEPCLHWRRTGVIQ